MGASGRRQVEASRSSLVGFLAGYEEGADRHAAQVAIAAAAQAHGVVFCFLGSDHAKHWDFLLFARADQFAQPVAAAIQAGANADRLEPG